MASHFATIATALSSLPENAPADVVIDDGKCSRADLETLACTLGGAAVPTTVPLSTLARLLIASDYLSCASLVETYAAAYARALRQKMVEEIASLGTHAELGMDLVRQIFAYIPAPAASMLCQAWAESNVSNGLLTPETARTLGADLNAPSPGDATLLPPLRSPLDPFIVERARLLVDQRGMRGANIVLRALDAFCPGGRMPTVGDRLACIGLRELVDEHTGGWFVREYVNRRIYDPVVSRLCNELLPPGAQPRPGTPSTVAHLLAGPGCGKTTACSLLLARMAALGYSPGSLVYNTETNVLKDAFNRTNGYATNDRNAPGKTVASFNYGTYVEWGNLRGLQNFLYAAPEQFTDASFTVPAGGYVHPSLRDNERTFSQQQVRSMIRLLNENPACVLRSPATKTLAYWLSDPSVRRLGILKTCFGGITRWLHHEVERRRARNLPMSRRQFSVRALVFDEVQNAGVATHIAINIACACGVLVLLMGDPNQNVCGARETPFDLHPASQGMQFPLNCTFRFGAAGAACYNRLARDDTPLLSGMGPAVRYGDEIPADATRIVFVGRTNVGALLDALDSGCAARLPVYVTPSIRQHVARMRGWLDRGRFPHTTPDSAGLVAAADQAIPDENAESDGDDDPKKKLTPWSFFYRYSSSARVRAFLAAFEDAALMPAGGPSALPSGAPGLLVTSTVSAVGSDLADFCVVAARDCFSSGVDRGHAVVALTRATGNHGVAVDLHARLAEPDGDEERIDEDV